MASSLQQWESDPLFSAAEVVQDSADRMESLFRVLLHDQDLVQGDHPDPRLLSSIEYHKRDLATILETAKWQLEDFERAVSSLAIADKSQTREEVTSRHWQFIRAIKEQIYHVQRSVGGLTMGGSMKNSEWVSLNEQDRDVLASFLTGGNATQHLNFYDNEDSSILRRFLDSTPASSLKGDEIVEYDGRELENVKMNGNMHVDHYLDNAKENNLRKVGSHYDTTLGVDVINSVQERHGDWDMEANEAAPRSFFYENRLRGIYGRMSVLVILNNLCSMCRSRVSRTYTKKLKDGEEMRHSPTYGDTSHTAKGLNNGQQFGSEHRSLYSCLRANVIHMGSRLAARDQIFPRNVQVHQYSVQILLTAIIMLIYLGILLIRIV